MSLFASNGVWSLQQTPVDNDATPDSYAQDDPEHNFMTGAGPADGFGVGEAIGVVGEPNRAFKCGF